MPCGFVVVQDWDLWEAKAEDSCTCANVLYQGNTLACPECGTVYGVAQFKTFRSGWSRLHWEVSF